MVSGGVPPLPPPPPPPPPPSQHGLLLPPEVDLLSDLAGLPPPPGPPPGGSLFGVVGGPPSQLPGATLPLQSLGAPALAAASLFQPPVLQSKTRVSRSSAMSGGPPPPPGSRLSGRAPLPPLCPSRSLRSTPPLPPSGGRSVLGSPDSIAAPVPKPRAFFKRGGPPAPAAAAAAAPPPPPPPPAFSKTCCRCSSLLFTGDSISGKLDTNARKSEGEIYFKDLTSPIVALYIFPTSLSHKCTCTCQLTYKQKKNLPHPYNIVAQPQSL